MISETTIEQIEKALNIHLTDWQKAYLLNKPIIPDIKITGRRSGKTLVHILDLLFKDDTVLDLSLNTKVADVCDWWCISLSKTDCMRTAPHYVHWFAREVWLVHKQLNDSGVKTRPVKRRE